jgi:lipopolysaccharide export system protein LptC
MNIRLIILLGFLAISFFWWLPTLENNDSNDKQTLSDLVPEYTATFLHQELFDDEGNLEQEVFSQKMEHYADLSLTHFKQPEFIIYQDDKPFWRISAKIGNMQDGLLLLENAVNMIQVSDNDLVNSITTEYLEINLNTNIVSTDNPIRIQGKNVTIEGKGLTADLERGTLSLVNHVKTIIKGS